jgi:ubiquinone/menaquinone biosynthesis C-methylase UbiE
MPYVPAAAPYFDSRFRPDERRDRAWPHIVAHLSRWWGQDDDVVDVGAGYCSFINHVSARRRVAVDIHERLAEFAAAGVECVQCSATRLALDDESFDVLFASNLLEHLDRPDIGAALQEFHRVLRPGGRVILMQPNFRLRPAEYFDDYTHRTPLSDRSLRDLLTVAGFRVVHIAARFLPLSATSRFSELTFLVPLYLRSPWRPLAGQMLLVGTRGETASARPD